MSRTISRYLLARIMAPLGLLLAMAGCGDDDDGSVSAPPVSTFALSGSVSHLETSGLTLSNGSETVQVAQGASTFAFARPLANGTAYTVTVATQPAGANCVVNNGAGGIGGAAVTNVAIACNTMIAQPVTLGVLPSISTNTGTRILLPVTQVGTAATRINAILDTGSSGTLLRASEVFPASMVSPAGFVFPAGQTSITYNGITVTNVVATRKYGDDSTELTGNLGFAQITFGSGTHVTTANAPVLFVYSRLKKNEKGDLVTNLSGSFGNIIGVNSEIESFIANNVQLPGRDNPCTTQSTTSCGMASPFRYLDHAAGIDEGFFLSKVTLTSCDSATAGSCPTAPNLTIGVTASTLAGFNTFGLQNCGPATIIHARTEQFCNQIIPRVVVSSGTDSFTGPMIFDTGTERPGFAVPAGMTFVNPPPGNNNFLPAGLAVSITTPSGFSYRYSTDNELFKTTSVSPSTNASNSGIGFFTLNSLVLDYSQARIGWRSDS